MKTNNFKRLIYSMVVSILVFSGCEAGLTSSDSNSEEEFSFSDIYSRLNSLQEKVENQDQVIETLSGSSPSGMSEMESRITTLEEQINSSGGGTHSSGLDEIFAGVSRLTDPYSGQDTIRFSGVNIQIVNGGGVTNNTNGRGNLILGYNEDRGWLGTNSRTGSHNIIVGSGLNYSSFGGLVAGYYNSIKGQYSSVLGGTVNTASGMYSAVSGGSWNKANGQSASVNGGDNNTASGDCSSLLGGQWNTAPGEYSTILGEANNGANSTYSIQP